MSQFPTPEDHQAVEELLATAPPMLCAYCGLSMVYGDRHRHPTRDHIWPKRVRSAAGGRNGTVWCCIACNRAKRDLLPAAWLRELKRRKARRETARG